jgi:uroporphyrinogen decarboxylase
MTTAHRERVLTALSHRCPDRVPRDYWATPEVTERLCRDLGLADKEALLGHLGADLRYVEGPAYVGQSFRRHPDGSVEDLWGVRRQPRTVTGDGYAWTYQHVVEAPLAAVEAPRDAESYPHWPSADGWDYSPVQAQCLGHEGFAVVNAGDRLDRTAQLKPMMYLRGMEQTYVDLAMNPEVAEAIIGRIVAYFLEYNRRVFTAAALPCGAGSATFQAAPQAGERLGQTSPVVAGAGRRPGVPLTGGSAIDIFMMGDDFGTQQGPMMSLETWRRFFRPGFAAYIELAHRYGIRVMHHTCGSVAALIPDFIECGLDILQSLQPQAAGMDLSTLRREYGRDLCFHGGLDIQGVLPHGTPEQVRQHVREQIQAAGDAGGYILCTAHNIQPDTPTANILALFAAVEDYGRYSP